MQPSREELVSESLSFFNKPIQANVSVDLVRNDIVMYYDSEVFCHNGVSQRNGLATVYCYGVYFKQECVSISAPGVQCKQWRGHWVVSDTGSLIEVITQWLDMVNIGLGAYQKQPVIPAAVSESLAFVTEETYCIKLYRQDADWKSICDVHLDSYFGGDALLTDFMDLDVSMYFSIATHRLVAILIESPEMPWAEASVVLADAVDIPVLDLTSLDIGEGILSEEWNIN